MKITVKDLKSIKDDLAKRKPAHLSVDGGDTLSIKESIQKLAPALRRMKKRGFTTGEMVEALNSHGLHIKGATLNRYLNEHKAAQVRPGAGHPQSQADAPPPMAEKTDEASPAPTPPDNNVDTQPKPPEKRPWLNSQADFRDLV